MTDSSAAKELERISTDLKNILFKRHQLQDRRKMLNVLQEFKNHAAFRNPEESPSNQHEIDSIDENLRQLSEREVELQQRQSILSAQGHKKDPTMVSSQKVVPADIPVSGPYVFFVEAPPSSPAPTVTLDTENLPAHPTKTQCPECREFITTQIVTSVGSVTWLVCFMMALIGCVAGCCLIPFCMNRFKTITHRCPKCRTSIHTIKKL